MAARGRPSLVEALRRRELGTIPAASFSAAAHEAAVPSHAFLAVRRPPPAVLRRYTPCGRYLVAVDRNRTDLRMYRLETGGQRAGVPDSASFQARPMYQNPVRLGSEPVARSLPSFNVNPFIENPSLSTSLHFGINSSHGGASLSSHAAAPGGPISPPLPGQLTDFTVHSCEFSRFFTLVSTTTIATGAEVLVPDFCLASAKHIILASVIASTADEDGVANLHGPPPAVAGVRVVFDRITFHLVDTETGRVRDKYVLRDDFVVLEGHAGVHMLGDLLCVLSIRHQTLHLLRVHDATGRLMFISRIGAFCDPDDEFEIARYRESELRRASSAHGPGIDSPADESVAAASSARRDSNVVDVERTGRPADGDVREGGLDDRDDRVAPQPGVVETGLGNGKSPTGFYSGLMHRLLVYVYRKHLRENNERLFFRVIGQYSMLVMKKAQMLDDDHLLIRLGSSGMLDPRTSTCFLLVYCVSSSRVVNLFENRSMDLLKLYEDNSDLFTADPAVAAMLAPLRSSLNGQGVPGNAASDLNRESASRPRSQVASGRARTNARTREILAELPMSSQDRNASVYLNRRLFSYPIDRLPALDGSRAMSMRELQAIKFTSVGRGNLRFKLFPGLPNGETAPDGSGGPRRGRRKVLFLFHPTLPFVISMQASQAVPTSPLINFHLRDT